jgi:tetratricopeptide (TPR) repeat protein
MSPLGSDAMTSVHVASRGNSGPKPVGEAACRDDPSPWRRPVAATTLPQAAAIGLVGLSIFLRLAAGELKAQTPAPPQPGVPQPAAAALRPIPDELDPGDVRSPLLVLPAGKEGRTRAVVALGRPVGPKTVRDGEGTKRGILVQELIRQAVLLAGRDELQLATRDEILDNALLDPASGERIEVSTVFRRDWSRAIVSRLRGEKRETIVKYDLGSGADDSDYTNKLATLAAALSRSELPGVLKTLGLTGEPNAYRAGAPLPAGTEKRLESLSLVENFAAVRDLHDAIRTDGESPARLGSLARGYAQLGVLSEYEWSPAHKVFKARGLLYAERLFAREGGSPWGLWNRAFVRALVGMHRDAAADLDFARKKAEGNPGATAPPAWISVIDAYLNHDCQRLELTDGPFARLAALLRMTTVEFPQDTQIAVQAARDVVRLDRDCQRAYDVICDSGGLGDLHEVTLTGPDTFTDLFPAKLKTIRTLPATVRKKLDANADEIALCEALEVAGRPGQDAGEPSWSVLTHLAREARFVHVWRRLNFMAYNWSVPVADYWADVQGFVARHRDRPYLESIASAAPTPDRRGAFFRFAGELDPAALENTEQPMLAALRRWGYSGWQDLWTTGVLHSDSLARDYATSIIWTNDKVRHGRNLLQNSPSSAFAMATLVAHDWDNVKDQIPAWTEKAGDAPALLGALGKRYAALKQFEEAGNYLTRYIKRSPDRWAYQALAACFEQQGDRGRWKQTLDEFLTKTEDSGLDHARVRVQIARDFMRQERWAEALPYAEAAAETWAGWAMSCASECNEGLKDWDRAEFWIRQTTERYPRGSWTDWYLFCKRTGHGDVDKAREFVEGYLARAQGRDDLANPEVVAYFYWSCGALGEALELFEKVYREGPTPVLGIDIFLLADELGRTERRDAVLQDLVTRLKEGAPETISICRMMQESLGKGGKGPLDLAAVDRVIGGLPAEYQTYPEYLVGRYLLNRGQPERAKAYLERARDSKAANVWVRVLAAEAARSSGPNRKR